MSDEIMKVNERLIESLKDANADRELLRTQRDTALSHGVAWQRRIEELEEELPGLVSQRDEARAIVAGLEPQVAGAKAAISAAPHMPSCLAESRHSCEEPSTLPCAYDEGSCRKHRPPAYFRCNCWKGNALAALSTDPLKVGEAAMEVARAVEAFDTLSYRDTDALRGALFGAARALSAAMKGDR